MVPLLVNFSTSFLDRSPLEHFFRRLGRAGSVNRGLVSQDLEMAEPVTSSERNICSGYLWLQDPPTATLSYHGFPEICWRIVVFFYIGSES